jgi:hypothetical protein
LGLPRRPALLSAGFADNNAASTASSALADAAKSGKLQAYLADEGIDGVTSASVDGAKVGTSYPIGAWVHAALLVLLFNGSMRDTAAMNPCNNCIARQIQHSTAHITCKLLAACSMQQHAKSCFAVAA